MAAGTLPDLYKSAKSLDYLGTWFQEKMISCTKQSLGPWENLRHALKPPWPQLQPACETNNS